MTTKRIYIVEDNLSFAIQIEMYLKELGYEVLGRKARGEEALDFLLSNVPDLVIMDVNLGGAMSGLELALALEPKEIPILFITAHDTPNYFESARSANMAGYLVKPFDLISLRAALEVVFRNQEPSDRDSSLQEDCVLVKTQGILQKVYYKDIVYINSEGNYSTLLCKDKKKCVLKISLRQILRALPAETFIRIHKSYVVNLERVDAIDTRSKEVIAGGERLPIGKEFKNDLQQRFRIFK